MLEPAQKASSSANKQRLKGGVSKFVAAEAAESVDISGAEGEADDVDDDARSNISNIINDEPEESEESADGVESENCCSIYTKNRGGARWRTMAHVGARLCCPQLCNLYLPSLHLPVPRLAPHLPAPHLPPISLPRVAAPWDSARPCRPRALAVGLRWSTLAMALIQVDGGIIAQGIARPQAP